MRVLPQIRQRFQPIRGTRNPVTFVLKDLGDNIPNGMFVFNNLDVRGLGFYWGLLSIILIFLVSPDDSFITW